MPGARPVSVPRLRAGRGRAVNRPRVRPPWRWRWGRVLLFLAKVAGWWVLLRWAPVLGIPCALWIAMQIRALPNEPLPSPTVAPLSGEIVAGHRVEKRYGNAQTTFHPGPGERCEVRR